MEEIKHLKFAIEQAYEVIHHYNKEQVERIKFFYLGLGERLYSGGRSLVTLIELLDGDNSYEFGAGLVMRTLLLDFLLGLRGYQIVKETQDAGLKADDAIADVEEYCNRILADGAKHTLKDFQAFQNAGAITEQQLFQAYEKMPQLYPSFLNAYQNDGVIPTSKFAGAPQIRQLFELLAAGNAEMKELSKHYNTYSFYSKYEHFGILSYDLMRRLEDDQKNTLKQSIELMVLHMFIIIDVMYELYPDDFLKSKQQFIGGYLENDVVKYRKAPEK